MSNFGVMMPFAQDLSGRIVGIQEVERGNHCNCVCLACKTPVTARKASVNQWHFGHRTDKASTESECYFSPVTAIALVLRQQLSTLTSLSLGPHKYEDLTWQIDSCIEGVMVDGYTITSDNRQIVFEIPFANAAYQDLDEICNQIDEVVSIDTHGMATALYASHGKNVMYTSEEILSQLLEHWEKWVVITETPEPAPIEQSKLERTCLGAQEMMETATQGLPPSPLECPATELPSADSQGLCRSCHSRLGTRGKGLLCAPCVNQQVGIKFINLTEMIKHYRQC